VTNEKTGFRVEGLGFNGLGSDLRDKRDDNV